MIIYRKYYSHWSHALFFLKHHCEELECRFQDKVWDVEETISYSGSQCLRLQSDKGNLDN